MGSLIKCVPLVIKDLIVSKLAICPRWLMWLRRSHVHRSARWFCHCFTPSPYSAPLMKCQKGVIEVTIGLSTQTSFLGPINTIEVRVVVENPMIEVSLWNLMEIWRHISGTNQKARGKHDSRGADRPNNEVPLYMAVSIHSWRNKLFLGVNQQPSLINWQLPLMGFEPQWRGASSFKARRLNRSATEAV